MFLIQFLLLSMMLMLVLAVKAKSWIATNPKGPLFPLLPSHRIPSTRSPRTIGGSSLSCLCLRKPGPLPMAMDSKWIPGFQDSRIPGVETSVHWYLAAIYIYYGLRLRWDYHLLVYINLDLFLTTSSEYLFHYIFFAYGMFFGGDFL